jgi:hypothetical protein
MNPFINILHKYEKYFLTDILVSNNDLLQSYKTNYKKNKALKINIEVVTKSLQF